MEDKRWICDLCCALQIWSCGHDRLLRFQIWHNISNERGVYGLGTLWASDACSTILERMGISYLYRRRGPI